MEKSEKKAGRQGLMRRFIPYFGRYKGVLVFDLFCAALTTVCELVLPMLVRYITDMGINNLAALTVATVLKIGGQWWANSVTSKRSVVMRVIICPTLVLSK